MVAAVAEYAPGFPVEPMTRAPFDLLVEAGVYDGQPVELLEGSIVRMAPPGPEHIDHLSRLARALQRAFDAVGREYLVRPQSPLAEGRLSEADPALAVVDDTASSGAAHPDTAHLVVEITRTSHGIDLIRKPPLYARPGVAQNWVVNLVARQVVVHAEPYPGDEAAGTSAGYATIRRLPLDTELDVLGITLRLSDVLS